MGLCEDIHKEIGDVCSSHICELVRDWQRRGYSFDKCARHEAEKARRRMPSLLQIVRYWQENYEELAQRPGVDDLPFCFGCLSEPPVNDWRKANGWLERAHLLARVYGGSNDVANIVPLCTRCHHMQPDNSREESLIYLRKGGWMSVIIDAVRKEQYAG